MVSAERRELARALYEDWGVPPALVLGAMRWERSTLDQCIRTGGWQHGSIVDKPLRDMADLVSQRIAQFRKRPSGEACSEGDARAVAHTTKSLQGLTALIDKRTAQKGEASGTREFTADEENNRTAGTGNALSAGDDVLGWDRKFETIVEKLAKTK